MSRDCGSGRRLSQWIWTAWIAGSGWLGLSMPTAAQVIDPREARAVLGQPLSLQLRIRDFEPMAARLDGHCLRAEVQHGDDWFDAQHLRWRVSNRGADGSVIAHLSGDWVVREPWLQVRVSLTCGAPFTREFTVISDWHETSAEDITKPVSAPAPSHPIAPNLSSAPTLNRSSTPQPAAAPRRQPHPTRPPIDQAMAPATVAARALQNPAAAGLLAIPAEAAGAGPMQSGSPDQPLPLMPVSAPGGSPLTDAFVRAWQDDVRALREEQAQTRAALAAITDRLAHNEQARWDSLKHLASAAAGIAALALLLRLGREALLKRAQWAPKRAATQPQVEAREPTGSWTAPRAAMEPVDAAPSASSIDIAAAAAPGAEAGTAPLRLGSGDATPPAMPWPARQPSRWAAREFGQAALDGPQPTEMLAQVDAMAAGGYLGAAVAVLENALHGRIGKSPAILLRLLDLYRRLQQAQNHERVSAELEAIYNVCVPPLDEVTEGRSLAEHGLSPSTRDDLALALIRPSATGPLDLAAFREAVNRYASLEPVAIDRISPTAHDTGSMAMTRPAHAGLVPSEAIKPQSPNWTLQALPG